MCGWRLAMQNMPDVGPEMRQRSIWTMRSAELFAQPGLYTFMLSQMNITISWSCMDSAYLGPMDNLSVEDVAHTYAGRGVSVPEAHDAWQWVANWIMSDHESHRNDMGPIQDTLQAIRIGQRPAAIVGQPEWFPALAALRVPQRYCMHAHMGQEPVYVKAWGMRTMHPLLRNRASIPAQYQQYVT
ncbi:hypothetical protein BDN71DRAFT_1436095 [Pleurotus eryngii]|uniref:Uncharacterized protein n=1 Tax=Pleurotus eryngii TaxID=5323 RepID=A0A9P5ZKY2_PLEER|nr:hypothetical protein BDN71DRAFT_1436095 [Pleurotus eryngii]